MPNNYCDDFFDEEVTEINCIFCSYCQDYYPKKKDLKCFKHYDMCSSCYSKHRSGQYLHNCDYCNKWYFKTMEILCKCKKAICSSCYAIENGKSDPYNIFICNTCPPPHHTTHL